MNPQADDDARKEPTAAISASAAEEVDVWWGSYAARAMLPSVALSLLLTAGLVVASFLIARRFDLAPGTARFVFYCLAGGLWLSVGLRWLYRAFGFNYRLTTRRLFCYWGVFRRAPAPVLLCEVAEVLVEQSFIEALLRVGTIRIETESHGPPTLLLGVRTPQAMADEIGRCVKLAKGEKS